MPPKKIIIAIVFLVVLVVAFSVYQYQPQVAPGSLNGEYVLDTASPYSGSTIVIASSTDATLAYIIDTVNFGHLGNLSGTAKRDISTTTKTYTSTDYHGGEAQEGCRVTVVFPDDSQVYYVAEDVPVLRDEYTADCSLYHGAHGMFFDGEFHQKSGKVTLPSILDLGFTEEDRDAYERLLPGALSAEVYIGEQIGDISESNVSGDATITTTREIKSADIPGSFGYKIESPNLYNGLSPCSSGRGGYCEYVAFMKDDTGGYWIMGGSNDGIAYATNRDGWKKKLPRAFKDELSRLGVKEYEVLTETTQVGDVSAQKKYTISDFSFEIGESYETAKNVLANDGWVAIIPGDRTHSPSAIFPEITDCGLGVDAVCSVDFKKGSETFGFYIAQREGSQGLQWVVDA